MIGRISIGCSWLIFALLGLPEANAAERVAVLQKAPPFENHQWTCGDDNLHPSCINSSWNCAKCQVGSQVGLPYNWGGYQTVEKFDQDIAAGLGPGQLATVIFSCTAGVDCSGYISQLWECGRHTTSSLPSITASVLPADMFPGDILNKAGSHVVMFVGDAESGKMLLSESTAREDCKGVCRTPRNWSDYQSYAPRRLDGMVEPIVPSNAGTSADPIPIAAFPFRDWRNTKKAQSRVFSSYSIWPQGNESGPEYIYRLDLQSPGTLSASVSCAPQADIDLHLLTALDSNSCVVRDNRTLSYNITSAGTYYLVADTFVGQSGEYTGAYVLDVQFDTVVSDGGMEPEPNTEADGGLSDQSPDTDKPAVDDRPSQLTGGCSCGQAAGRGWALLLLGLWMTRRLRIKRPGD